jgi:hypothetical protein
MESIWKEMVMAVSRYVPGICLDRLRKATKTSLLAKNRIAPIPYIKVIPTPNSSIYIQ